MALLKVTAETRLTEKDHALDALQAKGLSHCFLQVHCKASLNIYISDAPMAVIARTQVPTLPALFCFPRV